LKFYDALGEDVANELVEWFNLVDATYKADLKELNELNFSRFDAKLEQRVVQLEAKLDRVAAGLDAKIDGVAAKLDAKIDGVAGKLDTKIEGIAAELRGDIRAPAAVLKADLLKWILGSCATLLAAMIALIKIH